MVSFILTFVSISESSCVKKVCSSKITQLYLFGGSNNRSLIKQKWENIFAIYDLGGKKDIFLFKLDACRFCLQSSPASLLKIRFFVNKNSICGAKSHTKVNLDRGL